MLVEALQQQIESLIIEPERSRGDDLTAVMIKTCL